MNKYLRAISANFIFFAINSSFFLVITPVAIKVMGEEFYGLWIMFSTIILFSSIGNLGIAAIVMKFSSGVARNTEPIIQIHRVTTTGYIIVLAMSFVTAIMLLLIRNLIVNNIFFSSSELKEQFRLAVIWIIASIVPQFLSRVPNGFLLSQMQNRLARQIELFYTIFLWFGIIAISLVEKNLVWLASWCLISNILMLGLYLRAVQKSLPFQFKIDWSTLRIMLNFSGYMFLESTATTFFQQLDKIIVGITLGPALAGAYSVGTSVALRLSIVTGQATEVMIPYASMKDSSGDLQKLFNVFRQLSRYVSLILATLSSLLILWMHEFLALWISPDCADRYSNAYHVLILAYSVLSLSRPAHQTLTGMGKVKFTATIYLTLTTVMLFGLYFASRRFGLFGAVASNLILIFLLVFNLFVYWFMDASTMWINSLNDLKLGLFFPILIYGLSFIPSMTNGLSKIATSIILALICIGFLIKDPFIQKSLLKTLHSFQGQLK